MSDLQTRLAHLVNYSSQMIFIGCDAIADQQKYLTQFLTQQGENAEVSFLTAEPDLLAPDYRRTICRQLINQQVGSFVRPLYEEISCQDEHQNTFIICISKADLLPNEFLSELWQWVARTRASNGQIHLNILLFGSNDWSEKAQRWLPEKNNESPVLLSSQAVDAVGFDVNALESLMAQKRAFFANKGLFGETNNATSFIQRKWFIGAVLSVFLAVFAGLVSWQYPEQVQALLATGSLPDSQDYQQQPIPVAKSEPEVLIEVDETQDIATENTSVTDEILAGKWQQEPASSQSLTAPQEQVPNEQTLISDLTQALPAQTATADTIDDDTGPREKDFKVPDIISVEQLDQSLGESLLVEDTQSAEQGAFVAETVTNPTSTPVPLESNSSKVSTARALTNELDTLDTGLIDEYRFDESLLLQLPNDQVVLQLSGIKNPEVLNTFITSNNLQTRTWIYQTQRYGGPWYVVLYNDTFDSIDLALAQVSSLPESVQNSGPFAKSVGQIRNEIIRQ
ncbi:SPOR domain-containing protein [Glaciecola sp. 1036]|uniref:SPOR domain-containing protein n=1 Tax=Alteromonadaceae TaxID=72275 RepID=UPI003D00BEFB